MAYISFQPHDYFDTLLYQGNSTGRTFTDAQFQPDWVWIKDRTNARDHMIFDSVRGATKDIHSNNDDAETTVSDTLTAFTSNGFTLGTDATSSSALVNGNSNQYTSWLWKGGGASSSNSNGSITSTVSASTTSGFSIVKYTGTGSNATIGHGLTTAPQVIFVKKYNTTQAWRCGHVGFGWTHGNNLNNNSTPYDSDTYWQDTAPTTSVFSVGTDTEVNGSGATHIAYCFSEINGFSKFGKYMGNGNADGTFVYTGHKPAFVICKQITTNDNWMAFTNKIGSQTDQTGGHNIHNRLLELNGNGAEQSAGSGHGLDFCSNGFKVREDNTNLNGNGESYIYYSWAEEPLVSSNGVPATAG